MHINYMSVIYFSYQLNSSLSVINPSKASSDPTLWTSCIMPIFMSVPTLKIIYNIFNSINIRTEERSWSPMKIWINFY